MAIGDIYQMTTSYTFVGQLCQNVWHYELLTGTDPNHSNSLHLAFMDMIATVMLACMSDTLMFDTIEVVNLMDVTDFDVTTGIARPGTVVSGAAQTAASFVSFGYRLEKSHPGASVGHKRFPGVGEGFTAENVYDPPGNATITLGQLMQNVITPTALTDVFGLVVVKRPYSFAVPPSVWWPVTAVTYTELTTQSSRKF